MKLLIVFIIIWCLRLLINFSRFRRLSKCKEEYLKYLNNEKNNAMQYHEEIKILFKYANVNNDILIDNTTRGHRTIESSYYPIFENIFNEDLHIGDSVLKYFEYGIGTYKRRIKENFRITFLIECLIYLPTNILKYLNIKSSDKSSKIIEFIYWIIGILVTAYTIETKNLIELFFNFISSFF